MRTYKIVTVKEQELTSFKCNRCNKEMINDDMELQESHSIGFVGGYSSVFGDMNKVECDLCQQCLKDLIGEFCVYNAGLEREDICEDDCYTCEFTEDCPDVIR